MKRLVLSIEVPRPQADKTGRRSRTGPLTLYVIQLDQTNQQLAEENRQLRADVESLKQAVNH